MTGLVVIEHVAKLPDVDGLAAIVTSVEMLGLGKWMSILDVAHGNHIREINSFFPSVMRPDPEW